MPGNSPETKITIIFRKENLERFSYSQNGKSFSRSPPIGFQKKIFQKISAKQKTLIAGQLFSNLRHDPKQHRSKQNPFVGLLYCGTCGGAMMETFTQKKDKCYRYFACEKDMKRINSICPLKRVPTAELENLLLREIGSMLAKPEVIAGVMHQAAELDEHGKHLKLPMVQQAFDNLTNVWDVMFPVERYKFINEVVKQITVHIDRVEIEYKTDGLEAVITETEKANGKNN